MRGSIREIRGEESAQLLATFELIGAGAERLQHAVEAGAIDRRVAEQSRGEVGLAFVRVELEMRAQPRQQRNRQVAKRAGVGGAALEVTARPPFAERHRQRVDPPQQGFVAIPPRGAQHVGQHLLAQHLRLHLVERSKAGGEARLLRKAGEEGLAKCVDGLDLQPRARRVDDPSEQLARAVDHRRVVGAFTDAARLQPFAQVGFGQAHPQRQRLADAARHLARPGAGEGDGEDRFGRHPVEQQPHDARRQHLRLAGTGGGRQPDIAFGIDADALIAVEAHEPAHDASPVAASAAGSTCAGMTGSPPRPFHSSKRIS